MSCTLLTPVFCQDFSDEALEQGVYLRCLQQQQSVCTRPTVKPTPIVYSDAVVHTAYLSNTRQCVCQPRDSMQATLLPTHILQTCSSYHHVSDTSPALCGCDEDANARRS